MDVSVLVLTYNHEMFIEQCLQSILDQETRFEYEIFVYDDASTDSNRQKILAIAEKFPNKITCVFPQENNFSKGITSLNIRYSFPKSKGRYIIIIDGDDFWISEHKLERQIEFMEDNSNISLLHSNVKFLKNGQLQDNAREAAALAKFHGDCSTSAWTNVLPNYTPSLVVRRSVIEKIYSSGILDLDVQYIMGDYVVSLFASQMGEIHFENSSDVVYRIVPGSVTRAGPSRDLAYARDAIKVTNFCIDFFNPKAELAGLLRERMSRTLKRRIIYAGRYKEAYIDFYLNRGFLLGSLFFVGELCLLKANQFLKRMIA